MTSASLVSIVDDDDSVRESLAGLLRSAGYATAAFASAQDFLDSGKLKNTRCLIVDVSMPRTTGPELEAELRQQGSFVPIIFITARTEPGLAERLCQRGALACLIKPFSEEALLDVVVAATQKGEPNATG